MGFNRAVAVVVLLLTTASCAPHAAPLRGAVAPARLPPTALPPLHRKFLFHWSYSDRDIRARGDGAARVAPPDSVRIDLFIGQGLQGGSAVLIGDELRAAGNDQIRRYLPPIPLLWAALGRVAIPPAGDTIVRRTGDTLRADIGRDPRWRTIFIEDTVRRLELIDGGRIRQWVTRTGNQVRYEYPRQGRTLDLTITRVDTVSHFDATTWR
ncbi:MAG TPA: hypothetical protein VFW98_10450 [Gemmatimonadaceae bacterium]|nr:hypothetical protein [Gemmatimonadaceae bacterium]